MTDILHIVRPYNNFLKNFYLSNNTEQLNYQAHLNKLLDQKDFWSKSLKNNLKKFNTEILISNDMNIQKKWIKDILEKKEKYTLGQILEKQINYINPKIIFFQNIYDLKENIALIKNKKTKIIFFDGIAYNSINLAKQVHGIITCLKSSERFYKNYNNNTLYMPHGFDETIKFNNDKKEIDISFIGSVSHSGHFERANNLFELNKKNNIDFWLGDMPTNKKLLKLIPYYLLKKKPIATLKYIRALNLFKKKNHGGVFGLEMYKILNKSHLTLNLHIENAGSEAANMRMFEATGVGSCLITDYKENIKDFFEPDKEIVVFKDLDEATEKINYLINNKNKAIEIGINGKNRTLKDHSLRIRWQSFENFLVSKII